MTNSVSISVENISKTYRLYKKPADRVKEVLNPFRKKYHYPFQALKDISFEVSLGESLGIIGVNGSGKSTLLQIISGVLNSTSGSVTVQGKISAMLELGAGFSPEFTGRENVYINAGIQGLSQKAIDAKLDDILSFADIGEYIDQPVKTYSSGMRIRLAFAIMTQVDADILIIDEALAVGDVFFVQKCMNWIRNFKKKGTFVFVTHDIRTLTMMAKNAIWLHEGDVVMRGPAWSVGEAYLEKQVSSLSRASGLTMVSPSAFRA